VVQQIDRCDGIALYELSSIAFARPVVRLNRSGAGEPLI
jgi:hypothetical protein